MDPRKRQRIKNIFGLLQTDENPKNLSDANSVASNNRRPSRPQPYDEYQFSQRKKASKRAKSPSPTKENSNLPKQRQKVGLIKMKPANKSSSSKKYIKSHISSPPAKKSSSSKKYVKSQISSPPAKKSSSPKKYVKSPENVRDHDNDDDLYLDDDDSVCDKTYDPMIAGDLSSDETENEFSSKVKRIKKQLFTPIKREPKKVKLQEKSLVIVQAVIENVKSSKCRPIPKHVHKKQIDDSSLDLITPEDLGFVQPGCSKNYNNDFDLIINEELDDSHTEVSELNDKFVEINRAPVNNSNLDQIQDLYSTCQPSSLACLALRSIHTAIKTTEDSSTAPALADDSQETLKLNIDMLSPQMNRTRPVEHSSTKKKPRKRTRNVAKWKKTIAKSKRLRGLAYISLAKKKPEIRARELKPPCPESCRKKCSIKLKEEQRLTLFNQFWKNTDSWDQRRQYIKNNVEVTVKKYMRTTSFIENDKRKFTHIYTLPLKTGNITVCKTMFLNTFNISKKFVRTCLAKSLDSGLIEPDRRGHHIPANKTPGHVTESVLNHVSSYPSYQSHYNRENTNRKFLGPELNISIMYKQYVELMREQNKKEEDIAKSWLYREIFNTKFNLSFKLLEMDTCDDCDRFQRTILDTKSEEEKDTVVAIKNKHLEEAKRRYNIKKTDKEACYKNKSVRVLFLDLQKCLPTPYLTNTQSFYLRKLWTLNLTIYEASEKKSSNFVWPETVAGRGGNEVASCLLKWAKSNLINETITEIITWSDNCQGQNRNLMLVLAYLWIMENYPHVKTMSHKFLLKGHTHMEVDHVHSIIERKKKTLNTMEIAVPRDWAQFLRSCSGKNVFQVIEMTKDDFKDLTSLTKKTTGPFVARKKNEKKEDFKISETVMWKFDRNKSGTLFYKTDFTQENFFELDLVRKVGKSFKCPESLPNIRESEKPISTSKYKDLMTLLQWIPKDFHDYYKNLKHSNDASDLPEV